MAKNKHTFSKETPTLDNSHNLNTSAVDRLVEASKGDASGVNEEEVKKIKSDKKVKLPIWLKSLCLKWWFVGATCFFFYWGLGNYISNVWDKIIVLGLATGAVTDLLLNNFFRLLETSDKEYDKYMLFNQKNKIWTLIAYAAYALVLTIIIVYLYQVINKIIIASFPSKYEVDDVPFAVEPLSYGLIYLCFDMIVISIKNIIIKLINKNKNLEAK